MSTDITTDILQQFCYDGSEMYAMEFPWIRYEWRYATDGRIAVRTPAVGQIDTPADKKLFPKVWSLFESFDARLCETAWPKHSGETSNVACRDCLGTGRLMQLCPTCKGEGEIVCDTCHRGEQCETCDGQGAAPIGGNRGGQCPPCGGKGREPKDIVVGNAIIAGYYYGKIESLGNAFYGPTDSDKAVPFIADSGIQGIVMPIVKSKP